MSDDSKTDSSPKLRFTSPSYKSSLSEKLGSDIHMRSPSVDSADAALLSYQETGLSDINIEQLATALLDFKINSDKDSGAMDSDSNKSQNSVLSGDVVAQESFALLVHEGLVPSEIPRPLNKQFKKRMAELSNIARNIVDAGVSTPRSGGSHGSYFSNGSGSDKVVEVELDAFGLKKPANNKEYTLSDFVYKSHPAIYIFSFVSTFISIIIMRRDPFEKEGRTMVMEHLWEALFGPTKLKWSEWKACCEKLTNDQLLLFYDRIYSTAKTQVAADVELAKHHLGNFLALQYINEMVNDDSGRKMVMESFYNKFVADYERARSGKSFLEPADKSTEQLYSGVFRNRVIMKTYNIIRDLIDHNWGEKTRALFEECRPAFPEYDNVPENIRDKFHQEQIGLFTLVATAVEIAYSHYAKSPDCTFITNPLTDRFIEEGRTRNKIHKYMFILDGMSGDHLRLVKWAAGLDPIASDAILQGDYRNSEKLLAQYTETNESRLRGFFTAYLDTEELLQLRNERSSEGKNPEAVGEAGEGSSDRRGGA